MSEKQNGTFPFRPLGNRLKHLREKRQESLAEVSGAVEIDVALLTDIEQGVKRPSEDILLLLITHFSMKDEEATKLWELAEYEQRNSATATKDDTNSQPLVIMPMDSRIVYTDTMHVVVNNYGVVMNFMQNSGQDNQPLAVARVGMSKEHARSVLEILQKTLSQTEPKSLPSSSKPSDKHRKN